jgi:large subunit ribosomal protein L24
MRIHKGDRVIVRSGKYRGHRSEVVRAIPSEGRVVLEGVNVAKRHAKPTRATMQGGVIDKFMPVPVSQVALWCGSHNGPARIGHRIDPNGVKIRVCRKCGAEL